MSRSPTFRQFQRHSNSPVPLRSPSPDFMTKSAIISTPPTHIQYKQKPNEKTPLIEEVKYLREENTRLRQIAENKGQLPDSTLNQVLKEKDRIIDNLRSQLKGDIKSSRGLNLITNSNHRHSASEYDGDLKQQNQQLKSRIRRLIEQNDELKKKKTSGDKNQKPKPVIRDDPIPYLPNETISLDKITEQITRQFNQTLTQWTNELNYKLQNIERRVHSIQSRINSSVYRSGEKQPGSTIGQVSPFVNSNYNTGYNVNSFNGSEDKKLGILSHKIEQLQHELRLSKNNEHDLKIAEVQLQEELNRKNEQIRILREQLNKKPVHSQLPPLADSKSKISEQNISMKQTLSRLSAELTIAKNDKISFEKQYDLLKRELENERRTKINTNYPNTNQNINQQDQYSIQQLNNQIQAIEQQYRQKVHEYNALEDTLDEIRRNHNLTLNQLDTLKRQNQSLKARLEIEKEKADLGVRIRSDSNSDIQTQTENTKLKLRIMQLEREVSEGEFISNQLKNSNDQLNNALNEIKEIRTKYFTLENENSNLRRETQKVYSLGEENEMLKMTIASHERSKQQFLKGSNHTKNELIRLNQERQTLSNQLIEFKSQARMTEGDLVTAKQRLINLEKQFRKLEQQNNILTSKLNESENNNKIILREKDQLNIQHQTLISQFRNLEEQKFKTDNEKQQLFQQNHTLTSKLRDSEQHLTNSKKTQLQKNNELKIALAELGEVKRLLSEMKFDSVESIIRELQAKQRIAFQQKQELARSTHQSQQQINKLSSDNQRLRKDILELSQKFIEQKEKADRLTSSVNHMQVEKNGLNQRIARLEDIIKQYVSETNTTQYKNDYKQIESIYLDESILQKQLLEFEHLKEPIHKAVEKLDRIAEKIAHKVEESRFGDISQTQSHIVYSTPADSRKR